MKRTRKLTPRECPFFIVFYEGVAGNPYKPHGVTLVIVYCSIIYSFIIQKFKIRELLNLFYIFDLNILLRNLRINKGTRITCLHDFRNLKTVG